MEAAGIELGISCCNKQPKPLQLQCQITRSMGIVSTECCKNVHPSSAVHIFKEALDVYEVHEVNEKFMQLVCFQKMPTMPMTSEKQHKHPTWSLVHFITSQQQPALLHLSCMKFIWISLFIK